MRYPRASLFNHRVRLVFIGRFGNDRFMNVRIEALADRGDRFNTKRFQHIR